METPRCIAGDVYILQENQNSNHCHLETKENLINFYSFFPVPLPLNRSFSNGAKIIKERSRNCLFDHLLFTYVDKRSTVPACGDSGAFRQHILPIMQRRLYSTRGGRLNTSTSMTLTNRHKMHKVTLYFQHRDYPI